jgi:DNA mismatch repair ATPase MutS
MKTYLMYRDRDFVLRQSRPDARAQLREVSTWRALRTPAPPPAAQVSPTTEALIQDLELGVLFDAMAAGDDFLLEVARQAVLTSLEKPEDILYRQEILADCIERREIVKLLYATAVEAIERERSVWGWLMSRSPDGLLHRSVEVLQIFLELLKRLRQIADEHGAEFRSEGFRRLFEMLSRELGDEYLDTVEEHLKRLRSRNGILISAQLGRGNRGTNYILRKPEDRKQSWIERLHNWVEQLPRHERSRYVYEIADRDESGFRTLSDLVGRGISHVAAALGQSMDHILSFFTVLRSELGFYVGCLNLRDRLYGKGEPLCFPDPCPPGGAVLSARGLYDLCLSLNIDEKVVGNQVNADGKLLLMITGANRGGKSTFLRSVGLAQLMMQCGMFVPAEFFRANICSGVLTHFKREEDTGMRSGKLDEELARMSSVVDKITPGSIVLLNESFASTNEREGSEIARQIVRALLEARVKVIYVTHMFDLAQGFYRDRMDAALFLRAERLAGGRRTFRIVEGEPLPTSYGQDLYRRIFGSVAACETEPPAAPQVRR